MRNLMFFTLALLLIMSCAENTENTKPLIVTTTGMIGDIAINIVGDNADVVSLMGPGTDPHLYKASAGDVSRLRKADLILFNGLHLEGKMGEVLEKLAARKPVVAVTERIIESNLVPVGEGLYDPHIWFDIGIWLEAVDEVYFAIEKLFSGDETLIALEDAYRAYKIELIELEMEVQTAFDSIPEGKKVLITAHDAFGYLGKSYGFEVLGLQGISTVSEAGVSDVRNLADFIAEKEIPAIFVESSVPRKSIEALQAAVKERGYEVQIGGELFSDAMGEAGTVEGTYIGMVRHNTKTIVDALSK